MTNDELLEETNRLLRRLFELDEKQKAENEEALKGFNFRMEEMKSKRDKKLNEELSKKGPEEEALQGGGTDWEARFKSVSEKSRVNLEEMREQDRAYKESLLHELRLQSEILKQIAGKLGA